MKSKTLIKKAKRVLCEEGTGMLLRKTKLYIKNCLSGQRIYSDTELVQHCYLDVLFVNGCYLEHPTRYRVRHQREQLQAGNISTAEVFYQDLSMDYVKQFRMFVFFRCPYTELVDEFVQKAKRYNKTVLFDIDDLMVDTRYTNTISYVQNMSDKDKRVYDDGVIATGRLLSMCDGAVTTTEGLAEELRKYISDVGINRNVASEQMLRLSEEAQKKKVESKKIKIGYFSGSITHNPDFSIVLPALIHIMQEYTNVELLLGGALDIPKELEPYEKRIEILKMVNWSKLPDMIASTDINLAPLEDTVFNRAKSENKWTEAALVKVPTIASDVGSFKTMIEDGVTGLLCTNNTEEWFCKLELLVQNSELRMELAENAYKYVYRYCTSIYTGATYSDYIYSKMKTNIVFVLPVLQISGGALVTFKHAEILQKAGYDVTIFNDGYEKTNEIEYGDCVFPVISRREIQVRSTIDKCVATLWSTCEFLNEYGKIGERYYLVQNYETDFYKPGDALRVRANQTYKMRMPVKYLTISKWCKEWLQKDYDIPALYAPNGLETERFYPVKRDYNGKVRILIEGNSDDYYKNVDESFRITNSLDPQKYEIWYMSYQGKPKDWYRVDKFLHKVPYEEVPEVYQKCHMLVKSSILESFSYPPLEMMATGGIVVVAPNGGNVEYLKDGGNCLFYHPGDIKDALEKIEKVSVTPQLRETIECGGISTGDARNWNKVGKNVLELYQ